LILEGSIHLLGEAEEAFSLELLNAGSLIGWFSPSHGRPCEWAQAASPVKALRIKADFFRKLLNDHPDWATSLRSQTSLSELFPVICNLLKLKGLLVTADSPLSLAVNHRGNNKISLTHEL